MRTFAATTKLSSTNLPKSYKRVTNSSGFFIIFTAAFHSKDLGFLFLSTSIFSFQCPAIKSIQEANTSGTPAGGLVNDLAIVKSFFWIPCKDSLAYSIKGTAALRSASVDSFLAVTSVLI